ncbi:MAG TPA: hypothetical protein VFZ21_30880 [Gemmatimonadaceae bacterium]|nr:hypothetical protein [Gemmatimonadaceae bacterium]
MLATVVRAADELAQAAFSRLEDARESGDASAQQAEYDAAEAAYEMARERLDRHGQIRLVGAVPMRLHPVVQEIPWGPKV